MDNDTIITFVILGVSFLSWLFAQMKGNKGPQNKKRRPAQKPMDLGDEIENFLQEIAGNQPEKKPKPKPVIVKQKQPEKKITKPRQFSDSKPKLTDKKKKKRFETNVSKQRLEKREYGSKLDRHVSTYMDKDVKEHVEGHLTHDINQSVSSHLGHFSKDISRNAGTQRQAHPVVGLFKDRNNVARAIMLNEILSPPLSLRNKE
jgi:hypothetical protein